MMKISKFILLILIIFTPLKAIETYVELKVNNEIITNIDLNTQYKYLIALNNELKNANKETVLKLARESIIREVIGLPGSSVLSTCTVSPVLQLNLIE